MVKVTYKVSERLITITAPWRDIGFHYFGFSPGTKDAFDVIEELKDMGFDVILLRPADQIKVTGSAETWAVLTNLPQTSEVRFLALRIKQELEGLRSRTEVSSE
jgi:hypothetical protein